MTSLVVLVAVIIIIAIASICITQIHCNHLRYKIEMAKIELLKVRKDLVVRSAND